MTFTGAGVLVAPATDDGDGMRCTNHPYRSTSPGGICALCLQDKLGKLVSASSSFVRSSTSSSSSSPSFRSQLPTIIRLTNTNHIPPPSSVVFKRSKSTATHRSDSDHFNHRKRSFWSFLFKKSEKPPPSSAAVVESSSNGSNAASFGRKMSRSRSVGCGSRSFSGDFLDRISTGFGDCTLRRGESQRGEAFKARVPCGGLFGAFIITSSSSWEDQNRVGTPRPGKMVNGPNRNWGWAFGSPRRAFAKTLMMSKNSISSNNITTSSSTNATTNLATIPTLLALRGCPIVGE